MRENPEAASSLGLNIAELRFGAFVLSAAYGGAAGALMAHVIHVVSPENLDLALMVDLPDHDRDRRPHPHRRRDPRRNR